MIKVNRNSVSAPDILTKPKMGGEKETTDAISHHTGTNRNKPYKKFKVYRDEKVKAALIELFNGKCAYCDSAFLHVYSGDIEHFRPKGEIEEAKEKKPGYYWLASDWDNLLLSCRNCNQKLTHQIFGSTAKRVMGKMNQFPLSKPGKHVRTHNPYDGYKSEEPYRLLLNPCLDNPEEHLEYGDQGVIKARKDANGKQSEMGLKSIEVYVLQRVPLVMKREKLLIDVQAQIQRVKEAVRNSNNQNATLDAAMRLYFDKMLQLELTRLHDFLKPDREYLGLARAVIGEFLKVNFNISI